MGLDYKKKYLKYKNKYLEAKKIYGGLEEDGQKDSAVANDPVADKKRDEDILYNGLMKEIKEMVIKIDKISELKIQSDALKTLLNDLREKCLKCKNKKDVLEVKAEVKKARERAIKNLTEEKLETLKEEQIAQQTLPEGPLPEGLGVKEIDEQADPGVAPVGQPQSKPAPPASQQTKFTTTEINSKNLQELQNSEWEFANFTKDNFNSVKSEMQGVVIEKLSYDQKELILKDMSGMDLKIMMISPELTVDGKTNLLMSWVDNNSIEEIDKWPENLFNDAKVSITAIKGKVKDNKGLAKALERFND